MKARVPSHEITVSVLTGGSDRPYVYGLVTALMSKGVELDLIGSDELIFPELRGMRGFNFLNLRGDTESDASVTRKVFRISRYYFRLIRYAATAQSRIFHILWNNRFETFDRTLLMLYYRLLGKKIVLTAHNVNAGRRDSKDTWLNRLTLRIQYRLAHHLFVHTEKMKRELVEEFGVRANRATVIPLGINNAVPITDLTPSEAKQRLGIREGEKALLFFGRIMPYKGLEYLIAAFRRVRRSGNHYRLIIAGRPDEVKNYWRAVREDIHNEVQTGQVLLHAEFIPDDETEVYFKAADVLVLPYRHIYQSGVLALGYSFGLPILVSEVGALKDEVVEGETGFAFRPEDPVDLGKTIERYFASDLYANLNSRRQVIREYATRRYSWEAVSQVTLKVYAGLLRERSPEEFSTDNDAQNVSADAKAGL